MLCVAVRDDDDDDAFVFDSLFFAAHIDSIADRCCLLEAVNRVRAGV